MNLKHRSIRKSQAGRTISASENNVSFLEFGTSGRRDTDGVLADAIFTSPSNPVSTMSPGLISSAFVTDGDAVGWGLRQHKCRYGKNKKECGRHFLKLFLAYHRNWGLTYSNLNPLETNWQGIFSDFPSFSIQDASWSLQSSCELFLASPFAPKPTVHHKLAVTIPFIWSTISFSQIFFTAK